VDCHGSQRGFCTPGFVMSLFALYNNAEAPGRTAINDALAGNLCGCTGYRPIVEAAVDMYRRAPADSDNWLLAQGTAIGADEAARVARLKSIAHSATLTLRHGTQRYFAPRSSAELAAMLAGYPDATLLAGGTDVGLWVTKQQREL